MKKNKTKAVEVAAPSELDLTLQRQNKEKHLSNLVKELKIAEETTQDLRDRLELLKEELTIIRDNHAVVMRGFELNTKNWKFEEDPAYIENTKKLNDLSFRKKVMDFGVQQVRMENALESADTSIKSLKDEIARIQGELQ